MKEYFSNSGMLCLCSILLFSFFFSPVFSKSPAKVGNNYVSVNIHSFKNVGVQRSDQTPKKIMYQGIIVDANNQEVIIGAAIMIKGASYGTTSDIDGRFSIEASVNDILTISYIGYQTKEIKLRNLTLLNIELKEEAKQIDEVVVTAFGVGQKKESVVGAITQIKPSELKVATSNLSNAFAGKLAGVMSFQRQGEPGKDGSTFYIRGISTINDAARSPLIIIDGVEASASDLNALDSEVIDGFSILKDATATAMYGTRGANGVMIVTTKSGANLEKVAINARIEAYASTPTKLPEFTDGASYMELYNEAVTNYSTGSKLFTPEQIEGVKNGIDPYLYPNVDWYNELFKTVSFNQRANFNIRGGGKMVDYFMNANVNHESGMLKGRSKEFYSYDNNIDIMRYTFQNNLNIHLGKTATVSLNLGVELRDSHGPVVNAKDLFGKVMDNNPVDFPIMYPVSSFVGKEGVTSEYFKWGIYNGGNQGTATNPLAELVKGYQDSFTSTVRANLHYKQKLDFITPGLKFGALLSFKNWSSSLTKRDRGYNKYELKEALSDNRGYIITPVGGTEVINNLGTKSETTGDRSYYIQLTLNYDRTFADKHNVSAMLLYNQDEWNTNNPGDNLISSLPQRKMGVAARFSYDYDHRYMMEINMGYNGSENFAKNHRFGFFPSIAVGYNISEEEWFEKLRNVVSRLKVRGSFGLVGNADAGTRFLYLPVISLQGDPNFTTGDGELSFSAKGPVWTRFGNDDISWEVGHKLNVGMDISLYNVLNLSVDFFSELRKDIFQENQMLPNYMGIVKAKVYGNYGEVKNQGFDIALDYGKQFNKNLSIQFKGTFSYAHNEIRKYSAGYPELYPNKNIIGQSLNMNKGYLYSGTLFADEEDIKNSPTQMISGNVSPGDIKYVDIPNKNGQTDGIINDYDIVYLGHPTVPEIIYGFGPSIQWKNWDFSFFFQGVARTSLMMSGFHPFGTSVNRNVLAFIANDHWSPENKNIHAGYPRLTKQDHGNNTASSSYWLRDASFLKLKNMEIGYSWKKMRIYASGTNLLTFSSFKYWDPEQGGGNGLVYPTQRVFNIGLQLSL